MPYLIQTTETNSQKIHELKPGENTIGREADNSITVMYADVSRHHAQVEVNNGRIIIKDLKSSNSTFVNDTKVESWELQDGDSVRCGSAIFKFVHPAASVPPASVTPAPQEDENSNFSLVKKLFPVQPSVGLKDLLKQDISENPRSILMLRQENAEQRTVDKLKILLQVSKELSCPDESDKLLEKILALLFQIVRVDRAVILMVNEETGELEYKAAKFRPGIPIDNQVFYSKNITNFVYQNGEAFLTADACTDERFDSPESLLFQGIHSSMCVPMKPREQVIGVLYVDNLSMANVYHDEDLEFLTTLVNTAASAVENAQLYEKMHTEEVMRAKLESFFPQSVRKKLQEEGQLEIIDTEVTALFCDISGFTEMSSRMEPRQVIEMLNEYFKVMVEDIVFEYEGTLEKYIGDALLAIWGAPYQLPDDADKALKAAIAMQWAIRSLNEQWKERRNLEIKIHIGLNTGKVAAGNIGSPSMIQYAAIGDTTNVTSRICSAAIEDQILISQSTFDKLSERTIPIEPIPPVLVKGKDQPLQLYLVKWEQVNLF